MVKRKCSTVTHVSAELLRLKSLLPCRYSVPLEGLHHSHNWFWEYLGVRLTDSSSFVFSQHPEQTSTAASTVLSCIHFFVHLPLFPVHENRAGLSGSPKPPIPGQAGQHMQRSRPLVFAVVLNKCLVHCKHPINVSYSEFYTLLLLAFFFLLYYLWPGKIYWVNDDYRTFLDLESWTSRSWAQTDHMTDRHLFHRMVTTWALGGLSWSLIYTLAATSFILSTNIAKGGKMHCLLWFFSNKITVLCSSPKRRGILISAQSFRKMKMTS